MKKIYMSIIMFVIIIFNVVSINAQDLKEFTVNRIIDGDTFVVENKTKIRLAYIDAYEKDSIIHNEIMTFITPLLKGKNIKVEITGIDQYQRLIGIVFLEDGTNFNYLMVKKGYAVIFEGYIKKKTIEYEILKNLEDNAKLEKLGGWGLNLNLPSVDRKLKKQK